MKSIRFTLMKALLFAASTSVLFAADQQPNIIVLFADDPLFRLMWPSQFILFANALLLGPVMR